MFVSLIQGLCKFGTSLPTIWWVENLTVIFIFAVQTYAWGTSLVSLRACNRNIRIKQNLQKMYLRKSFNRNRTTWHYWKSVSARCGHWRISHDTAGYEISRSSKSAEANSAEKEGRRVEETSNLLISLSGMVSWALNTGILESNEVTIRGLYYVGGIPPDEFKTERTFSTERRKNLVGSTAGRI